MRRSELKDLVLIASVTAAASAIAASLASALVTYLITKASADEAKKQQAAALASQLLAAQMPMYSAWKSG